jgi:hypothetical protein
MKLRLEDILPVKECAYGRRRGSPESRNHLSATAPSASALLRKRMTETPGVTRADFCDAFSVEC